MILIDTNILVYTVNRKSPDHERCSQWVESRRDSGDPLCTTWPIVYEFLRVATHPSVFRPPLDASAALDIVDMLVRSPGFEILIATVDHARVARQIISELPNAAGNIMHDVHTVVLMREHGVRRICTHDADFSRFPHIEVIDPTSD